MSQLKKKFNKIGKGFTLIELMIVVAIVSISAVVMLLSFGNARTKKELETNAREFASVIREAQNYALTGKQVGSGVTCRFDVVWENSTYNIYAVKRDSPTTCPVISDYTTSPNVSSVASYSLKQGVSFGNASFVNFDLPWANIVRSPVTPSGTPITVFSKSGFYHSICLEDGGKLTDKADNGC